MHTFLGTPGHLTAWFLQFKFINPSFVAGQNPGPISPYKRGVTAGALREWQVDQAAEREAAGSHWQDTGRVSRLIRPEETSFLRVTAGAVGPPVLTHAE